MREATAERGRGGGRAATEQVPPSTWRLVAGQVAYANRAFRRTPVAAFFTLVLPMLFLVLVGVATGNEVIDGEIRVAQFFTPALLAFGVAMATFALPAIAVAQAREDGVLKRLRGTPLPAWAYLAGRVGSATLVALCSASLLVAVAVVLFDVQVYAASLPAALVALLLGITTFLALAFAVVALVGRSSTVQTVTNGTVIVLGFVSNVFIVGEGLPGWFQRLGEVFPLKHLVEALVVAFDPYRVGSAWRWQHLAVMAAWAAGAAVIAVWRFTWQPPAERGAAPRGHAGSRGHAAGGTGQPAAGTLAVTAAATTPVVTGGERSVTALGRPPAWRLLAGQVAYATRQTWRDVGAVFFAIAMPLLLVLLLPAVFGDVGVVADVPIAAWVAPAMAVYGIAIHAFVNVPERFALARDSGALKRVRGTPLPAWIYLGGRLGSVLGIGALIVVVSLGSVAVLHDVALAPARLPAMVGVLVLGTTTLAVLGLAVASMVRSAKAVPAISLGLLLPLSFVSDVFLFGSTLPRVLDVIGWTFPLRHYVHALVAATNGPSVFTTSTAAHVAVLAAWTVGGGLVALRAFRWDTTAPGRRRGPGADTADTPSDRPAARPRSPVG